MMKQFLLKGGSAIFLLILAHIAVAYWAGGHTDAYYLRYTSPVQHSLILGTSRAAQGLVPEVLNRAITEDIEGPIYNFAFTNLHSPYGNAYRTAIQRKLDPTTRNGRFILSVDPWGLSVLRKHAGSKEQPRASDQPLREMDLPIQTLDCVTCKPNWEYLFSEYPKMWGNIVLQPWLTPELFLHEDGWLEVTVPMNEQLVAKRTKEKIAQYRTMTQQYQASEERLAALSAIIDFLGEHGKVVLVRLPVGATLLDLEHAYWPKFSEQMRTLAVEQHCVFEDLTSIDLPLQFTDGNHLYKESARQLSLELAKRIEQ